MATLGILLAAGFSRRFGTENKLLQRLPDGRLIAEAAGAHLIQAVPHSLAVVRAGNELLAEIFVQMGFKVLFCCDKDVDMADSLTAVIRHAADFGEALDGFVIALGDMPFIEVATIQAVSAQIEAGASIVIPTYQVQRGHPIGFAAQYRDELLALQGDEGARSIIRRHDKEVRLLETDDAGILKDIDTPQDIGQR